MRQDTEGALAAEAVTEAFLDHELSRLKANLRGHDRAPQDWQEAAGLGGLTTVLTVDELREITARIEQLIRPYAQRLADPTTRPADGRWVRLFYAAALVAPRRPVGAQNPRVLVDLGKW